MAILEDLIGRPITAEPKDRHRPTVETLAGPISPKSGKPNDQFEADVFNHLVEDRNALGIRAVLKFTALLVDGAVELADGRRLIVEVKYRMNWEKACQAEWQFRTFLKRKSRQPFQVDGGIVVFEQFSGDWARKPAIRKVANGWNFWYMGHADVNGLRLDLLRLIDGELGGYPVAGPIAVDPESPKDTDTDS